MKSDFLLSTQRGMQFYDEVKITVASGKGGNGIASGRREAGIPF
jgi:GTPase involved in cell partitioning and DNA repair